MISFTERNSRTRRALPDCDYREIAIIFTGVYFIVFFAALLLSLGEHLFADRREQVWIPDKRCLDVSQSLAERLIAQDLHGVFDYESGTDQFDSCPAADADEIDAKEWDGFRIRGREASDWAVIRWHRGPVVGALLARLAQDWNPDDLVMGRLREEQFDHAFEMRPAGFDHYCLANAVCDYFINAWQGVAVVPCDEVVVDVRT